jgi:hypothetical protein
MKIALLTIADEGFGDVASRTYPSMRRYAEAFGLDFVSATPGVPDRPAAWGRINHIRDLLRSGYDYCFYMDADAMFVRFDADIRDYIAPDKDLHWCWHGPENAERYVSFAGHFNSGVMVYRNSAWSLDFLDEIWRQTDYINHHWWEQAAALHLLGYRNAIGEGLDAPDAAHATHLATLPADWNAVVGVTAAPDPIIRHFAERPRARRLADIDREIAFQPIRDKLAPDLRGLLAQQLNLIAHQSKLAEEAVRGT